MGLSCHQNFALTITEFLCTVSVAWRVFVAQHANEWRVFCKIGRTDVSLGVFDVEARTAVSSGVFDVEARTAMSSNVFDGLQKNTPMSRVHWRENTPLSEKHAQHATQPTVCTLVLHLAFCNLSFFCCFLLFEFSFCFCLFF